jgi:hypothetical protein
MAAGIMAPTEMESIYQNNDDDDEEESNFILICTQSV